MQHWFRIASKAADLLEAGEGAGWSSAMARQTAIAKSLGTSRQSLSNSLQALRFVRVVRLADEYAAEKLMDMSATNVLTLSRWWRHDPERTLQEIFSPTTTNSRALALLEQASRANMEGAASTSARSRATGPGQNWILPDRLQRILMTQLHRNFEAADLNLRPFRTPFGRACGVSSALFWDDRLFEPTPDFLRKRNSGAPYPVTGFVELPARLEAEALKRSVRAAFPKAIMATSIFPVVVLLAPEANRLAEMKAALPEFPLVSMGVDPSEGWRLSDDLGIALFVSRSDFFK